ncbi:MAG: GNAT family N-acetyltransferase [Candidatus Odinarchaeota archaeon]
MKEDLIIRKALNYDAKGIHEVLLAAFEEFRYFYTPEGFKDTVMSEEDVIERMKEMTIYVAIDDHQTIIGTIGWQKIDNEEAHIRGMAVHPKWQGEKSPAATLLSAVEKDAIKEGFTYLTLDTTTVLKRARSFYKKHGFEKTGKNGNFFGSIIYEYIKYLNIEQKEKI